MFPPQDSIARQMTINERINVARSETHHTTMVFTLFSDPNHLDAWIPACGVITNPSL
jgi:hypothetical protein